MIFDRVTLLKSTLIAGFLFAASAVYAQQADEGRNIVERWVAAFNAHDLDAIVSTYSPEAIVWGTVARERASSHEELRAYFTPGFARKTTVELTEHTIRVVDGAVVDAGQYVFKTPVPDGSVRATPSRFHFVATRTSAGWKIIAHHSSVLPPPPTN